MNIQMQHFYFIKIWINNKYNLNLTFPDLSKLKASSLNDLEELRNILLNKECEVVNKDFTANLQLMNDKNLINPLLNGSGIRIVSTFEFDILGKKVVIDKLAVDITDPKFSLTKEELETFLNSNEESIPVNILADKNTRVFYRLIDWFVYAN